ncbi:MAG: hypothetical protein M9936_24085 [Caldilinea sp.]|nr:hypothetical protein [Caldilineaceae bacterium]MCO5212791.1 hypothetical protein [Caldilinea sp.]
MSEIRSEVQKQARNNILQYAVFRWESAAVIALTLIVYFLAPGPLGLPRELWLVLGLVALGLVIYSSISDADTNARVLLDLYQEKFDPKQIKDKALRKELEEALEYQRRIEIQVRKQQAGLIRDRLEDAANQLSEWVSNIYQLALRLDAYQADDLLARERNDLPQELQTLTAQRQREQNAGVQQQLDQVIASKSTQWQTLRQLDARMQQAQLQMDQSLTALATVYSQVQLLNAEAINSGRAERLRSDIQEQVQRLDDLVASLNEVYDYGTQVPAGP